MESLRQSDSGSVVNFFIRHNFDYLLFVSVKMATANIHIHLYISTLTNRYFIAARSFLSPDKNYQFRLNISIGKYFIPLATQTMNYKRRQ